ncbi:GlsB/YeaQ/YmgE family stress response membrane protein [Georgenia wangjunii]|uniref:GlsB/YeaQ/YmgE family stress response membrane protein n=1 Tax=Georgenia wangjunii TaxID=3117730 RepID=UPI002F26869D
MGEIIGIIIAGAIIGALARLFMKGDQNLGILWTIILGALGALVGTWIAGLIGVDDTDGIDWIRWAISIVMAILFISIYLGITNKGGNKRVGR